MPETVLLFDLSGVIARHQSPEGRNRLLETAALSCTTTGAFRDTYWRLRPRYDQGLIHGSEYRTQVARALDIVFDDRQIADLTAADIASWSAVDAAMVALLDELAASGRRLALLSNIPEELAAHYEIHRSWLEMFQVRGFSCRIGDAKPNPAAFRWCLDALAVPADQVVFVDDRGENIQAAQTIGMRWPPVHHPRTRPRTPCRWSRVAPSCHRLTCSRLGDKPLPATGAYPPRPASSNARSPSTTPAARTSTAPPARPPSPSRCSRRPLDHPHRTLTERRCY